MTLKHSQISFENWKKDRGLKEDEDLINEYDIDVEDYKHELDPYDLEEILEATLEDEELEEEYKPKTINDLDALYHPAYEEALTKHVVDKLKGQFDDYASKYKDMSSPIILYRAICLDKEDQLDRNNLGLSWTDIENSAYCYDKFKRYEYSSKEKRSRIFTLKAKVPFDAIDWSFSLWLNIRPGYGGEENELYLLENQTVEVIDIKLAGKWTGKGFKGNTGKFGKWKTESTLFKALHRILAGKVIDFKKAKERKAKKHTTHKDAVNEKNAIELGIREKEHKPLLIRLRNIRRLIEEHNENPDAYTEEYSDALEYERLRLLEESEPYRRNKVT